MGNRFKAEQRMVRKTRAIIHKRYLIRETIITLIIAVIIICLGIQLFHAYTEKTELGRQVRTDRTELIKQEHLTKELRLNIRQLHSQKYVEQLLSQRFAYSKPGQTVYNLPGSIAKDVIHH